MGAVTKTFKSGNSVAVRLPKELGIEAGVDVEIDRRGAEVVMRKRSRRTPKELAELLISMPKPSKIQKREKIIFPKRPGL
jgi:antitoxin VapB